MGYERMDAMRKTRGLRNKLAERQNWRCCYCGCSMQITQGRKPNLATFEHVVPLSYGGPNVEDNMVIACYLCNTRRGNNFYDVHYELHKLYENGEI